MADELQRFFVLWDQEAQQTAALLRALPPDAYDFRPDAGSRSLGELAWHLAEGDAYTSFLIEGGHEAGDRPPGITRPRHVAELAPGYERVHAEARERLRHLDAADLGRTARYFDGSERSVCDLLWNGLLLHLVHHRGQLSTLCRLAGGVSPGLYGPNREETAARRAAQTG